LDGEEFKKKKYDVSQSLSDLRTKLGKEINETSLFLDKKGEFINLEDEENLCISQILKDNKLNLKTKPEKKNELEAAETPDDNNEELNKDSKTKGNITSNTIKDNEKQKNGKSKTENSEEGSPNDDDKKIKKKTKNIKVPLEEESSEEKKKKKKKASSDEEDISNDEDKEPKKKK